VTSRRKPNLVVFLPDQLRADAITPAYAPNLAKLAGQSVVFERAYVTHPVCTPSRSSIMTGTWPHQNGCTRNSVALPAKFKCLPQLVDGSYTSAYFGKWHLGNDSQPQRGFQHWLSTEGISDYSRLLISHGHKSDREDGTFSPMYVSNLPIELSKTRFLKKHACEFIEKHRDKAFVLFVAFVEPHSPYNGPLNNFHHLAKVQATTSLSDRTPLRYQLMREWQESEALLDRKRLPEQYYFGIGPEECEGMRQRYLGLVTQVDQSIGAILDCLARNNLAESTIVVHTSDHGDMLGDHGLFGKEVMFEEAVRVPWLIRLPGQQSARRIASPASLIDFLPTLVELLGGESTSQLAGTSRAGLIRGEDGASGPVFIEWAPNRIKVKKATKLASRWRLKRAVNESTRTILTSEGWKLSLRDRDLNELYYLPEDPSETSNLHGDGKHGRIVGELAERIHNWQKQTGDNLRV
jgi:N-acetylglucosamine-6-sulfatase